MKLLLHACCADCTIKFLAAKEDLEVEVYYYNPNIHPRAEYLSRLKAMQKICGEAGVKLIVADWSPKEYFEAQNRKGNDSRDKKTRCPRCWQLRLGKTAKIAAENKYDYFSSTLVSSEYQDKETIEKIAQEEAKKNGIEFWRPENVDCKMETKGFYKQFFCGCVYSLQERMEEKYLEE